MFIPLYDAQSLRHIKRQYVTILLILVNVAAYLFTGLRGDAYLAANAYGFGFTPAFVDDSVILPEFPFVPDTLTYVTYAFLHGDFMHLAGNMLFLWVFGDNVEDALGHWRFLLFYLLAAAAGAWFHALMLPGSQTPLIGASGAVAGVVAAYVMLHPRVRLWVLVLGRFPLPLPAFVPLVLWIGYQFVMFATAPDDQVSWPAHVGGIIAGAVLVLFLRRRGVPLFDRYVVRPAAVEVSPPDERMGEAGMRWGRQ